MDVQLYTYDSLGQPLLTCQDIDLDGQLTLAGPDRVTGRSSRYVEISGDWWQETASWTYAGDGSSAPLTNAVTRNRLKGLDTAFSASGATGVLTAESVSRDARSNETVSRTVIDRDNKTVYRLTYAPGSSVAALSTTVNGLLVSSRSTSGLVTTYAYDALGRMTASQDARGAVRSRGYDGLGRVAWESDPATNGTWYAYDDLGRRTAVTNALGQVTWTAYDLEGRTIATWGATYPVAYEYDAFGRMTAMATLRDAEAELDITHSLFGVGYSISDLETAGWDLTRWYYDAPTGLLTNKLYADGKGTAYSYTPDGKLASRTWARGVTTTYAYTNGSSLAAIDYSDDTPDVAFTYDRLGRMTSAVSAVATNLFTYDDLDLVSESQNGSVLSRATDALGRPAGIALSASPYDVSYAYDIYGRFIAVTAQVHVLTHGYTYSYLADTDLVESMANSHGHTVTRTYDPVMPYITRVHNGFAGARTISQYDYTYDALGRRTAIANSGEAFSFSNANDLAAFNLYGYNTRSEVTSATRYWGTDTDTISEPVAGQEYAYAFDAIGNRITAAEGDTDRTATYTANALNQYTQRTVPGVKELAGTAITNATVTVNGLATDRHGPWWRHAFEVDNASAAAYTQAVVCAVYNPPGTNDPDVVSSATGLVFVAETPETFTYDDDGNLLSDGRFTYAWDAENRLISVETATNLPAAVPRVRLTHAYDYQSRRLATAREEWNGSAWQPAGTNRYVYDGWNLIAEVRAAAPANTNLYIWGLDLSGTLQGAGGIGGLLTVRKRLDDGTGIVRNYDYLFDANGNVVQETFRTAGAINAHYEYDPFGIAVIALRVDATDNPFRFSTKWCDNDTGLGYWGYRWYGPGMGRWLSRDPIGERGGLNLYHMCFNDMQNNVDADGLSIEIANKQDLKATLNKSGARGQVAHDLNVSVGCSWWGLADQLKEKETTCKA